MIHVFQVYCCNEDTFFIAVDLLDSYLTKTNKCLGNADLHRLGITCIFIAGKIQELNPFGLSSLCSKISRGRVTPEQVIETEGEILQALEFRIYEG